MKFLILLCGVVSISHDVIIYFWTIRKFYRRSHCIFIYIPRYRTCEERETPRMIRFKSYSLNTVQIWWHVNLSTFIVSHIIFHNSRYRYAAVSCMERYWKMLKPFFLYFQNINYLFTVLSCEHKNGTSDLYPVWFMWAWTYRYKRRASEAVYII